jgi:hypothetical protein
MLLSLLLSTFYLLVTHTRWKQGGERGIEEMLAVTREIEGGKEKEISLEKRAAATGNVEEEERCMSFERLAYSC